MNSCHMFAKTILTLLLLTGACQASLTYEGPQFVSTLAGEGNIAASFVLHEPPTAGTIISSSDISSFSVKSLGHTVTEGSASFAFIELRIGAGLLPTDWFIVVEEDLLDGPAVEHIRTIGGVFYGASFDHFFVDDPARGLDVSDFTSFSAVGGVPASWSLSVPEPPCSHLVLLALLVMPSLRFLLISHGTTS